MEMTGVAAPGGAVHPAGVHPRSPVRAAVLSLVTASIYGFWWWDLNRQLRVLGQPARPWRALAMVTLGWLVVAAPLLADLPWVVVALSVIPVVLSVVAVYRTADLITAAQLAAGRPGTVSPEVAVTITTLALLGAVTWLVLSLAVVPVALFIGIAWPLVAMVLVGYLQTGFNSALGADG